MPSALGCSLHTFSQDSVLVLLYITENINTVEVVMLRSPPSPLSVSYRSAVWCDTGLLHFEAEVIIEPQTAL
jgi:hypothetical protein